MNYMGYSRAVLIDAPWDEFELPREGRILDAGSGTGWAIRSFEARGLSAIGLDLVSNGSRSIRGSVTSLPFRNRAFDVVVCARTLMHVADELATVREFARVLRANGFLLVSVPNRWSYTLLNLRAGSRRWAPSQDQRIYRVYSRGNLVRLLNRAGFEIVGVRSCHFLPRWLSRHSGDRSLQFFADADSSFGRSLAISPFGPLLVACGRKR